VDTSDVFLKGGCVAPSAANCGPPVSATAISVSSKPVERIGSARIVFDLTTNAMWVGPPAGIVRAESEFARWALQYVDHLSFAFFDPDIRTFCQLSRDMADRLRSPDAFVDAVPLADPRRRRRRKTDRIPLGIKPFAMWLLQSRLMTLRALERIRLTTSSPRIASLIDNAQRILINGKYAAMIKSDGSRRACFPKDIVSGPPVGFRSSDILVCTGAGWAHHDIKRVADIKQNSNCYLVVFCYDIIPLMFPEYFKQEDVEAHRAYFDVAFSAADLIVFGSRAVEADAQSYCATHGLTLRQTAVCALGADMSTTAPSERLPEGLESGHYALLVSTIEPRKGHRFIYDIWKSLTERRVPQRKRFKLVFVGREGWMTGALTRELRSASQDTGTILVLNDVDDATLATLYKHAAFCLFPSRYEGYGLPVVEAFFHGKAVLASTGGAIPEVVGNLSPCLDPEDAEAWRSMLETWINEPAARTLYESRIGTCFQYSNWSQSAATFFSLVRSAAEFPARS
jgi:glycosyltransferase involved in cell wall biosynthesis